MTDYILLEKYSKNINILYVEDDDNVRKETFELLEDIFEQPITMAIDGKDGFNKYMEFYTKTNTYFDLVLSDIIMPKLDGIELTKMIYLQNPNQSIIILSAHNDSKNLLRLVNIGIDQFILKPFDSNNFIDILFQIIKKIYLQKHENNLENLSTNIIINSSLYWDNALQSLFNENEKIKLTKKELLLVSMLFVYPNKTYTNEEILIHLWKDDLDASPDINNLKNVIWRLRKKVPGLDIENIYSFGYRINI